MMISKIFVWSINSLLIFIVDRLSSKVIVVGAILASLTTLMFGLTSTPWIALVLSLLFD